MPPLLRGILEQAIRGDGDCELLKLTQRELLLRSETMAPPDVVILGLTATEDETIVPALFARWPAAQVMTVLSAGKDAAVYELRPRKRSLGQMSPEEVLATLRDAVHRSRELQLE